LFGRHQRVGVTAEAVVQDRDCPVHGCHRGALSPGFDLSDGGLGWRQHSMTPQAGPAASAAVAGSG
jgi:hypothetical protein